MMGRHIVLCLVILGVLAVRLAFGDSDPLAPYRPFDEPKPKLPNEILTDTRLDKRVKVFVKSKNLQQLFAELSAKTDVKLQTNQKLWGERAIIYFHDRPLRDVMTEIANLFGYHWSVKGFPGSYRYELYEDSRHAKRRDGLRKEQAEAQNELVIEFSKKLAEGNLNQEALKRIETSNPRTFWWLNLAGIKDTASLLMQLGEPFLRNVFAAGKVTCTFGSFAMQWQTAMCDRANRLTTEMANAAKEEGIEVPEWTPFTPQELASVMVNVESSRSSYSFPRLLVTVDIPDKDDEDRVRYMPNLGTPPSLKERELRDLAGLEQAKTTQGMPLPEKPEITIKELRWLDFWREGLLLGDVLQGIGEQSDMDVIADYYHRGASTSLSVQKVPISKLVPSVCQDMDYSSRFDGSTIHLRLNKWFVQPLCEEPPASLIERCWKSLEDNGCISLDVQMEIASLPEKQMKWPGFGLIHAASFPAYAKDSLRFLKALGPDLRTLAQSEKGLPASGLMPDQYNQFVQWAATLKPDIPPSDLQQSVITLEFDKQINDDGGNNYKLILTLPDGSSYPARISMMQLQGDSMKGYPACHRKDLKADVIEVLD